MTRWTHLVRLPGPNPDRCRVNVTMVGAAIEGEPRRDCGCNSLAEPSHGLQGDAKCTACGHDMVPQFSLRPSDSPVPR